MPTPIDASLPTEPLAEIALAMERFEASPTRPNIGTGARAEGGKFEILAGDLWDALGDHLSSISGIEERWPRPSFRQFSFGERSVYLPTTRQTPPTHVPPKQFSERRQGWFERTFAVPALVRSFPGEQQAIHRFAPSKGDYAWTNYPRMYEGRTTEFDGTILLEDTGVLVEKILVEYKTAKSSRGISIDGNAHERLSFQILQYLEVATIYPRCSFAVFANGAFAFYKNKYHVNFHIQAERLSSFSWFHMEHRCTAPEYTQFIWRLIEWLVPPAQGE